jgi:hypothetical protein
LSNIKDCSVPIFTYCGVVEPCIKLAMQNNPNKCCNKFFVFRLFYVTIRLRYCKWDSYPLNDAEYFIKYFQVLNFSDLDKWYFVNYLLDFLFMWKVIALTSTNFAILNNSFKKTGQMHCNLQQLSIIVLNFPSLSNND